MFVHYFRSEPSANSHSAFQQTVVCGHEQRGFSSRERGGGASSQQQITLGNKAFCRRSWTLLLHDCFLSCRATINPLPPPLTLSFYLIYISHSPPATICYLFIYLTFFFRHTFSLLCSWDNPALVFFSVNVKLLMNFPPINCSGSLSFTCSTTTRKSRYRNLPFRSFEWNSHGVHKSGYELKVLAITLFSCCSATVYLFHIFHFSLLRSSVHID